MIGVKWQIDAKFIPRACHTKYDQFFQYTIIDEASRERFIYPYDEHNSTSTVDFIKQAISYFGYIPKIIQTDNGSEFTHGKEIKKTSSIRYTLFKLEYKAPTYMPTHTTP